MGDLFVSSVSESLSVSPHHPMSTVTPVPTGGASAAQAAPPAPAAVSSIQAARRIKFAQKHRLQQRYKEESNRDPNWFKHSKHILICSWSGRPIYTRYGDESKLAGYMGVITALISNFQRMGDSLKEVRAGPWKFVFLCKGPIYLIAISRTSESTQLLLHQLSYAHLQILSVLTNSVTSILEQKPSYDIRNLLQGTETMLTDLLDENDTSPYFLMDSIQVLRMPKSLRTRIGSCLRRSGMKNLLFGLLLGGGKQLIHIVRGKDRVLHPQDCLILMNFLTNSQSLRSSEESWTPICLPHFSNKGFLYAYICYLPGDLCLTLLTADSSDFANLRQAKSKIVEALEKRECLTDLTSHISSLAYHISLDELDSDIRTIMDVKHFLYRSDLHSQLFMSLPLSPYSSSKSMRKWLFRRYQHILSRVGATTGEIQYNISTDPNNANKVQGTLTPAMSQKKHQFYYEMSDFANLFCVQRPGEYVLLITFGVAMTDKSLIMQATQKILKWIQKEAPNLFI